MYFKIFLFNLWWPFCSAEQNGLCNFGRRQYKEHFCEITLNLDQWLKLLKDISISSSGSHFVQQCGTVCTFLVEGIIRHISVKFF